MAKKNYRLERDFLGEVKVPQRALYGGQTQRALENFPLKGERSIGCYPTLIQALLQIKWAAALTNHKANFLETSISKAISTGAQYLINQPFTHNFPVHYLHGGGGTSANMNANEVLANYAEESLGGKRGRYQLVHPNNHVNLHQSSNDVYPSACRMAVISQWLELSYDITCLQETLRTKKLEVADKPRIARTCLQDAVNVTFGDLFGSYESLIARVSHRIGTAVEPLYTLNLGGTIVGRSSDTPEEYQENIIPLLQEVTRDAKYHQSSNLFDAAQNPDELIALSSSLEIAARSLIKISKDLRLLNSGPDTGLGEIQLPALQPGSSIMPGKINPVIPEFVIQCCFQVVGNHTTCAATIDHGELDLNVWESMSVFNILNSMNLLSQACSGLAAKCIKDLVIVSKKNDPDTKPLIPLLTDLMKSHSYSEVSRICQEAEGQTEKIRKLLKEKGWA